MKKYLLSGAVIAVIAGYAIYARMSGTETPAPTDTTTNTTNTTASGQTGGTDTTSTYTPKPAVPTTPTKPTTPTTGGTSGGTTATGAYKDGSYTGDLVDAYYGNVQVKAVIAGGKITDVQFLAYPNDPGTTIRISTEVIPVLKSEAIKKQNAQVAIISGATQTVEGFNQSLASALVKAK